MLKEWIPMHFRRNSTPVFFPATNASLSFPSRIARGSVAERFGRRWSRVQVLLWPPAGIVPGSPWLYSSATLVHINSSVPCQLEFLICWVHLRFFVSLALTSPKGENTFSLYPLLSNPHSLVTLCSLFPFRCSSTSASTKPWPSCQQL